ncbi:AzlC family ABC transporter permease [Kallotenue papyrolyticum]|uniref:AzlC family ABC transporter permease n=1 Tax=Kallotenue papyrolyticum TaxID=1325125 RepID=UPI00047060F0|nr:AzlC family ABC transporter permease [Kallotenue papyrolyticum]
MVVSGEKRRSEYGTERGHDDEKGYLAGARAAAPFALATAMLGVSFGVLARSLGWGIAAPIAFSLVAFSGSAQFAVVAVFGAGGGAPAAIMAAVLLNTRFLAMGLAVAPSLKGGRLRRAVEAQAVVDSSWALASRGGGQFDRARMIGATVPQYVAWVVGTVVGVLVGDVVGDVERLGLDALFPTFFLVLLVEQLRNDDRRTAMVALLAALLALLLMPFTPPGVPVIAACVTALLGLSNLGRRP